MDKYEPAIVVFTTSNCTQRAFTWVKKPLNIISQQSITELSVQLCKALCYSLLFNPKCSFVHTYCGC